ncbi:phosphoadenylyl-sulfate reductase (thioredoxin) [Starmerella bacillaris]|uniref:Phosphoadenylyl-sulfate reductase (Thioredoxin) n=1 Tax=Starmerella bacillaris TaxID=1247836 RepID=A0AAV5RNZ3_STABA|nr:phosphoadenylyl-sulfate reductase (thioredoxin) [Starmerella bacillaris]
MFTKEELAHINSYLTQLGPEKIIEWAIITIPGLYQTTALGLSGLVTMDIISKNELFKNSVDLIFIDTLHHFKETLTLLEDVKQKYPNFKVHVYRPENANTESEFAEQNGEKLWETNELFYDYLVKVEPADRAYKELGVKAVFTGRRRSQGGDRETLQPVEITNEGLIKINPLYNWSFPDVKKYIETNNVPYNSLLDKGYRSVGDYHSTEPVAEGEDERAGRWKGKAKSECGIHDTGRFAELRIKQDTTSK